MKPWPILEKIMSGIDLPAGYSIDLICEQEIEALIADLKRWYPNIQTGSESCHLDPHFYRTEVQLKNGLSPQETYALLVKKGEERVALYTTRFEENANQLIGRLTVVSPEHRNHNFGFVCVLVFERLAELMQVAMAWVTATLLHPYTQKMLEKRGFQVVGIIPAWDRDCVEGRVCYVPEALYVKVFANSHDLLAVDEKNMTEKTKMLWNLLHSMNSKGPAC